jgi:hypothetical protein
MAAVTIWYYTRARHYFKGPIRTIDEDEQVFPLDEPPAPSAGIELA